MAVNNDTTNKLYSVNDTSVKFFSSLTRKQALGQDDFVYDGVTTNISNFPGAICYVSDASGNSIFLNKLLFGDGAKAGSGGSGGGITEITLEGIPVVVKDGTTLKTLANYFSADGTFITESLDITDSDGNNIITLDSSGITISGKKVLTEADLDQLKKDIIGDKNIQELISTAEQNAKAYTDEKLTSIYKIKGSINTLADLKQVPNPEEGWVYNVIYAVGKVNEAGYTPPGTNYVYANGQWDALGGTLDLSAYKTANVITQEIQEAQKKAESHADSLVIDINNTLDTHSNSIQALNNSYTNMITQIGDNTTKISNNSVAIENNTTNITNISTQLTWQ